MSDTSEPYRPTSKSPKQSPVKLEDCVNLAGRLVSACGVFLSHQPGRQETGVMEAEGFAVELIVKVAEEMTTRTHKE